MYKGLRSYLGCKSGINVDLLRDSVMNDPRHDSHDHMMPCTPSSTWTAFTSVKTANAESAPAGHDQSVSNLEPCDRLVSTDEQHWLAHLALSYERRYPDRINRDHLDPWLQNQKLP